MLAEPKQLTLNEGQQAAADGFHAFLFSKEKEIKISGPAGTGKTYTMGYLIDQVMPEYLNTCQLMGIQPEYDSVVMTATTNKAAEVLALDTKRPTQTIHSFLGLKVTEDYATGRTTLTKTRAWQVHQRKIIFIDEAYITDTPLLRLIREATHNCKIVWVGDHCQLGPVMEEISPIHLEPLPFYELTQPMRNAGQPALMALCQQLRNTVETGVFHPIHVVPGIIDLADDQEMEQAIAQIFRQQTRDARILAYTNARVIAYNDHIRHLRGLPMEYGPGEFLVNNQAIQIGRLVRLSVEEEVEIIDQAETTEHKILSWENEVAVMLEVRSSTIKTRIGNQFDVMLPVDRDHYARLVKYYSQKKDWDRYFYLKQQFPDLRPRDVATVHKAQGSTYDTTFIDLGDLSTCRQPKVAARLLYVAFSRAKKRVIMYGDLAQKYGGVIV